MRSRDLQPRLLYPAKLSFGIEGQIKSFPDKKKLKEFVITTPLSYAWVVGSAPSCVVCERQQSYFSHISVCLPVFLLFLSLKSVKCPQGKIKRKRKKKKLQTIQETDYLGYKWWT